jgi:hypothetical protein
MKLIASICAVVALFFLSISSVMPPIAGSDFPTLNTFANLTHAQSPVQLAHRASGRLEIQIAHRASGRLETIQIAHRASGRIDSLFV